MSLELEQIELRAERLRVALMVLDVKEDFAQLYPEPRPLLSDPDLALARTLSSRDRALAQACLDVSRDMRRREWAGLESLLAAVPPGGNLSDIYDLPAARGIPALRAAQVCGWLQEARD